MAPPTHLIVRQATVADVPLIAATRIGDPDAGPADPRMVAYLEGRHHPRLALAPRVIFMATIDDSVAGYVGGHLTRRFDCEGELQYLYVTPQHRRAGVASRLVHRLAGWFVEQKALRVCVNVNAESPAAEPFYVHHGAQPLRPHWMVWPDISDVLRERQ